MATQVNDAVLKRILGLLDSSGKEQQEFARDLGFNPMIVTHWKAGRTASYMRYIDKIAQYFGVSIDYLLTGNDERIPHDHAKILEMYNRLNEDNQKLIEDLMIQLYNSNK